MKAGSTCKVRSKRLELAKRILRWTKVFFAPVAFAFLIYFAWRSRDVLATVVRDASLSLVAMSVAAWCLLHLLSPVLAVLVLGGCGSKVTWRQALSTHASRLPARYAPGGIWHTVGRVMDYHESGVQPRHLAAFVLLENGLAAALTLAVGGAIVFLTRRPDTLGLVAAASSLGGIIALPIIAYVVNARVLKHAVNLPVSAYAASVAVVAAFWAGACLSFLLYLAAFPSVAGSSSLLEMGGVYLFSWGIGFVSIFAPQGFGVFEVVASEYLKSSIGFMGLAALLGGFRGVTLIADLVVWFAYQMVRVSSPIASVRHRASVSPSPRADSR